jgi:hypothetical protein
MKIGMVCALTVSDVTVSVPQQNQFPDRVCPFAGDGRGHGETLVIVGFV